MRKQKEQKMHTSTTRVYIHLMVTVVISALILTASEVKAETGDSLSIKLKHSLTKGATALQFRVTEDFTLGSWQSMALSLKRHFSVDKAVRIGIDADWSFSDSDRENMSIGDNTRTNTNYNESNRISFYITPQYLKYLKVKTPVKFYYAIGLKTGAAFAYSERNSFTYISDEIREWNEENNDFSWNIGLLGNLGAEWFASHNISFIAEYEALLYYRWTHMKITRTYYFSTEIEKDKITDQSLRFSMSSARLGLTLYF